MATAIFLVGLLLVALLALAEATRHVIVTTTTVEEEGEENERGRGRGRGESCREQLQRSHFRSCQTYLRQRGPHPYGGGGEEEEEMMNQQRREQQGLRECCNELRNIREECRCEAVRHIARQTQQEGGSFAGEEFQEVIQRARYLPRTCNLGPRECHIPAVVI